MTYYCHPSIHLNIQWRVQLRTVCLWIFVLLNLHQFNTPLFLPLHHVMVTNSLTILVSLKCKEQKQQRHPVEMFCPQPTTVLPCHSPANGGIFTPEPQPQLHQGQPGISNSLQVRKQINNLALTELFIFAAEITNNVMAENGDKELTPTLPTNVQLAQNANHLCQYQHPQKASL